MALLSPSYVILGVSLLTQALLATALQYSPINPPPYPLAVRNPYLSTWIPGSLVPALPTSSPQFWNGKNLTWSVIGRVDGTTYSLMGVTTPISGINVAEVQQAKYTSTNSIFTLKAGSVTFTLDFFSPVAPWNYVRQSLPFSM